MITHTKIVRDGNIKIRDLRPGFRVGRLVLKRKVSLRKGKNNYKISYWYCDCDCGTKDYLVAANGFARKSPTQSCRCFQSECISNRSRTHGEHHYGDYRGTPEYETWVHMIGRCYNSDNADFPKYGGRGIEVCDRWKGSYKEFLKDMGRRPSVKHSIDRFPDNNGNYEPGNCRWATKKQQNRNRRSNRVLTINGVSKIIVEWAEITGVGAANIRNRLDLGWSSEDAVMTPVRGKK